MVAGRYRRLLFLIGTLRLGVFLDASRLSAGFAQFRVALRRRRAAPPAGRGERLLQLVLNFRETAIGRGSRCLLLAEHRDQRLQLELQLGDPAVSVLESAREFALADRQDVGSDLQVLAVLGQRRLS